MEYSLDLEGDFIALSGGNGGGVGEPFFGPGCEQRPAPAPLKFTQVIPRQIHGQSEEPRTEAPRGDRIAAAFRRREGMLPG